MNFIHVDTADIFLAPQPIAELPPDMVERINAAGHLDELGQRDLMLELAREWAAKRLAGLSFGAASASGERLTLARDPDLRWRR